jgi:hypothetical protein
MEVHKPKPVHGWRDFAKEVGIIVLGVLIALGAEQTVEMLRWRAAVRTAREALHREIAFDNGYFRDWITMAPCMDQRIAAVTVLLDAAAAGKHPTNLGPANMTPGRLTLFSQWNAEEASQTLTHFPGAERTSLGTWYDLFQTMRDWIQEENTSWAHLGALTSKGPISPQDVALMRQDLQTVRNLQFLMTLNGKREIDRGRELGVTPVAPRQDFIDGICTAPADQPLTQPR